MGMSRNRLPWLWACGLVVLMAVIVLFLAFGLIVCALAAPLLLLDAVFRRGILALVSMKWPLVGSASQVKQTTSLKFLDDSFYHCVCLLLVAVDFLGPTPSSRKGWVVTMPLSAQAIPSVVGKRFANLQT